MFISGLRTGGIFHVGDKGQLSRMAGLPEGVHNARPFRNGVLFNDTASDCVRYVGRDGTERSFAVPQYEPEELTHTELADNKIARQAFGRGLCVINDEVVAAGSSPSTITLYHLESGSEITRVNFTMDIRNAIHGLEVWPY